MKPIVSSEITKARVSKWLMEAKPLEQNPTWTERRLAIKFGECTYLITGDQVFQCAHCGHYDPKWTATEVIAFFEETFGIKPVEVEITCAISAV